MDTDKPLFKDNHANRNPVFKDNHANRNPCPGKRVFSLVKNEYCQTSPLGGLPLTKLSAPLAHISTPSIGIDVDTEGATEVRMYTYDEWRSCMTTSDVIVLIPGCNFISIVILGVCIDWVLNEITAVNIIRASLEN